jgi:hypothetical protein
MKGLGYAGVDLSENSLTTLEGWSKEAMAETLAMVR